MSHENNPSVFGVGGNNNARFGDNPSPVPDTRRFVDYKAERAKPPLPPSSVFKSTGYPNVEPTVLTYDLSVARTDLEIVISGNLFWYQNSTNTSDIVRIKYERNSANPIPFQPGNKLGGVGFSRLYLTNAVIAGATATIIILQDSPQAPISVL